MTHAHRTAHPSRSGTGLVRLVPVLLAAALAVACSSSASSGPEAPPAPEVSVAQVVAKPVREWDDFTGRVSAIETVELRPRVSGYVERVAYEEGQQVRKGDLLFRIDPRPYRAALDRAEAELARARSEAKLARAQNRLLAHAVDLVKPGGVLIYCTCSIQPEEGEAQIDRILTRDPRVERVPIEPGELGGMAELINERGELRSLPGMLAELGGIDGFFVARLRRLQE